VDPFVTTILVIAAIVCAVCLVPVLLFRPLVLAISKRILGTKTESEELKQLRGRVSMLESQLNEIHSRIGLIEDTNHFQTKVLEDVVKKSTEGTERPAIGS